MSVTASSALAVKNNFLDVTDFGYVIAEEDFVDNPGPGFFLRLSKYKVLHSSSNSSLDEIW